MEQMHSPTLGALAKALAAAQASLKDAKKDATNPHFKNRYASLSSVRDALQLVLPKHGLSTVQTTAPHGDAGVCVVTWLLHESGEWIRGELFLPVAKKDPQAFGSALSYARRYALAAIVGISSDEDDDAEQATKAAPQTAPTPAKAKTPEPLSPEVDALAKRYVVAKTADDIAAADAGAARLGRALSQSARQQLLELRAAAAKRLSGAA